MVQKFSDYFLLQRMLPFNYVTLEPNLSVSRSTPVNTQTPGSMEVINDHEKVIGLTTYDDRDDEYEYDFERKPPKKVNM